MRKKWIFALAVLVWTVGCSGGGAGGTAKEPPVVVPPPAEEALVKCAMGQVPPCREEKPEIRDERRIAYANQISGYDVSFDWKITRGGDVRLETKLVNLGAKPDEVAVVTGFWSDPVGSSTDFETDSFKITAGGKDFICMIATGCTPGGILDAVLVSDALKALQESLALFKNERDTNLAFALKRWVHWYNRAPVKDKPNTAGVKVKPLPLCDEADPGKPFAECQQTRVEDAAKTSYRHTVGLWKATLFMDQDPFPETMLVSRGVELTNPAGGQGEILSIQSNTSNEPRDYDGNAETLDWVMFKFKDDAGNTAQYACIPDDILGEICINENTGEEFDGDVAALQAARDTLQSLFEKLVAGDVDDFEVVNNAAGYVIPVT